MASTIITKNSSTASAAPAAGDLTKGELAVNVTDKKLYTKDNSGAVVKVVGSLGNQESSAATITGGTITGITDLTVADGGTGASTAANARTNLGAAASGANSDITSITGLTTALTVAQGGTGASTAENARTSLGLVIGTDVLAPNGSAANLTSFPTLNQNTTGNAATVTTNANLTGAVTSVGNATSLGSFTSANLLGALTDETGTGSAVFATSPTLVTPILGTPTSATLTNATGLPLSTGVTGTLPVANGGTGTATPSIVAGTNITVTGTWPNQTIDAAGGGGSGTVTSVSVVSANGLAGTVATATSTPAITLSTSVTGVLKGNGTAISAATAGTDYVTPTGTETLTNKTLTNPTVTNYVETPFTANSSTAITLDLTNGTVQIITLTGNATITMPTATSGKSFILFLKQDGTGSRTVTWSTVKWPAGTAPTITSTASRQDIFSFFADGTNWYGTTVGQNYTP